MGLLGLLSPIKTKLIAGIAVLAALGLIFGTGYAVGQRNYAAKESKAQQKEVVKFIEREREKRVEVKIRDVARERELNNKVEALTKQRDQLKEILSEKPGPDSNVRLRVGDVRLLNDAATGAVNDGVSDPARIAAYQEQAPSSITLRRYNETELQLRFQYNELAARHDKLVDWVQTELIDSQVKKK